jgi:nitrate reductase NapAB chaperone NapD
LVVSSLILSVVSTHLNNTLSRLESDCHIEVLESDEQRIAVLLETESTESAADLTREFSSWPGVSTVELVAHFFEDEILGLTAANAQALPGRTRY